MCACVAADQVRTGVEIGAAGSRDADDPSTATARQLELEKRVFEVCVLTGRSQFAVILVPAGRWRARRMPCFITRCMSGSLLRIWPVFLCGSTRHILVCLLWRVRTARRVTFHGCAEQYLLHIRRDPELLHKWVVRRDHVRRVCLSLYSFYRHHERFSDAAVLMRELAYEVRGALRCCWGGSAHAAA